MRLNKIGPKKLWRGLLVFLVLLMLFAWIDGGREPQRLIEQPVELPQAAR